MAWAPGEQTPIHDHIAWCVVAVLAGTLTDWRYLDRGSHLELADQVDFAAGRVDGFAPPGTESPRDPGRNEASRKVRP